MINETDRKIFINYLQSIDSIKETAGQEFLAKIMGKYSAEAKDHFDVFFNDFWEDFPNKSRSEMMLLIMIWTFFGCFFMQDENDIYTDIHNYMLNIEEEIGTNSTTNQKRN